MNRTKRREVYFFISSILIVVVALVLANNSSNLRLAPAYTNQIPTDTPTDTYTPQKIFNTLDKNCKFTSVVVPRSTVLNINQTFLNNITSAMVNSSVGDNVCDSVDTDDSLPYVHVPAHATCIFGGVTFMEYSEAAESNVLERDDIGCDLNILLLGYEMRNSPSPWTTLEAEYFCCSPSIVD